MSQLTAGFLAAKALEPVSRFVLALTESVKVKVMVVKGNNRGVVKKSKACVLKRASICCCGLSAAVHLIVVITGDRD